jgi:hypothetical protein
MKPFAALLVLLTIAVPSLAAENAAIPRKANCVKVELLDQDSLPVRGQPAVVGLLVGGKPIIPEAEYPRHFSLRAGEPAACPAALVESVAQSYKDSCLTAERRVQTATVNNASRESVATQCQTIREALGESLAAYLK